MTKIQNSTYDLEDRTLRFAQNVSSYIGSLPKNITNLEYTKQLARSSGSVGANYIEANESLGKKDFLLHIKISRKEAKESRYWLLLTAATGNAEHVKAELVKESTELMKIFGAILLKST